MTAPFDPPIGVGMDVAPNIRRVVAPNPSPMTYRGTNTYILGSKGLAVIDPGPDHHAHLSAILAMIGDGQHVSHIFVTHSHLDHSPLAGPLSQATGAQVYAFGAARAGRSEIMTKLAAKGFTGGGEGVDARFSPDILLQDGDQISGTDWTLQVIHTPGHLGNHICLASGAVCFTGDHVMGWASSLVSPPDGDLTDFMKSCARLGEGDWSLFLPGHGPIISDPNARLDWLISHRQAREAEILAILRRAPATPFEITRLVYSDVAPELLPAAERNVLAHLIDLVGKSIVSSPEKIGPASLFQIRG